MPNSLREHSQATKLASIDNHAAMTCHPVSSHSRCWDVSAHAACRRKMTPDGASYLVLALVMMTKGGLVWRSARSPS